VRRRAHLGAAFGEREQQALQQAAQSAVDAAGEGLSKAKEAMTHRECDRAIGHLVNARVAAEQAYVLTGVLGHTKAQQQIDTIREQANRGLAAAKKLCMCPPPSERDMPEMERRGSEERFAKLEIDGPSRRRCRRGAR
jgi:hypothetical protein